MKIKVIDFGYEKLPERAHYNDVGADVQACFHDGQTTCIIWPNETVKIPLGMGVCVPDGHGGFVFPRSGLSSRGIVCEIPPIDPSYRGEINAIVTNCSNEKFLIRNGDRIGQLVVMPVILAEFIPEKEMAQYKERGTGAFGSTGK